MIKKKKKKMANLVLGNKLFFHDHGKSEPCYLPPYYVPVQLNAEQSMFIKYDQMIDNLEIPVPGHMNVPELPPIPPKSEDNLHEKYSKHFSILRPEIQPSNNLFKMEEPPNIMIQGR